MMRTFGLTGGIASGKSTVATMFHELGVVVIDSDRIARQVVEPGSLAAREIAQAFGSEAIKNDGSLYREWLATRVFNDGDALAKLNAIVHPKVLQESMQQVAAFRERGERLIVLDIPLLYEARDAAAFDGVIVVWVSATTQLERLMARNHFSEAEAKSRIAAQLPLDEKARRATWVIDNEGTLEETKDQVTLLFHHLMALSPRVPDRT